MRISTPFRTLAVAAAMSVSLAACGGGDDAASSDDTTTPSASETSEPSDDPSSEPTEAETTESESTEAPDTSSNDITEPGTTLAIGEKANVPFEFAKKKGVIAASVVKVDNGSKSDFKAFDQETQKKLKGYTPYYVRIEMSKVSGDELAYGSATGSFKAITSSGEEAQQLTAIGSFEPCDSESFPKEFDEGASVTTCVIGIVPGGGDPVVGGEYSLYDSKYDSYEGKPVVWK